MSGEVLRRTVLRGIRGWVLNHHGVKGGWIYRGFFQCRSISVGLPRSIWRLKCVGNAMDAGTKDGEGCRVSVYQIDIVPMARRWCK